jgi:type VI protein secretion system component VasA
MNLARPLFRLKELARDFEEAVPALAEYSSVNCCTRLTLEELARGECRQWPVRQV